MAFDFPNAPTLGQVATTPAGATFTWDGSKWVSGGATTVSIAAGTGIVASPSPITGSGTISLSVPVSVANGGTGSTTAAAAPWVEVGGDTMTGSLTLAGSSSAIFVLNKAGSGLINVIGTKTNNLDRWQLHIGDSTGESGSNAGSNLVIQRFNDAGTLIDVPLQITRSSGDILVPNTIRSAAVFPRNGENTGNIGNVVISWFEVAAHAHTNTSDPRRKRDIAPAPEGAINSVLAVPVINYRHIDAPEDAPLRTGFSAVDLHAVHPDAVRFDDEGYPAGYSLSDVNALLWKAVQELTARVVALEGAAGR